MGSAKLSQDTRPAVQPGSGSHSADVKQNPDHGCTLGASLVSCGSNPMVLCTSTLMHRTTAFGMHVGTELQGVSPGLPVGSRRRASRTKRRT